MKTLCFSLGLLLLAICCCDAMPEGLSSTAPGKCCFKFSERRVPPLFVLNVTKTHSSCEHKAFILETTRGRQICYRQSFEWAQNVYNQLYNTEGSSQ
ncbi:C-C motif chemokine 4-like [Cheilinus undulatus]|uniref:C-C motif chemokine 4-like n=1 Tax=Cheilinus undulatus TaxID=241271 RepID=UPI001BD586F8|nr:C-C motif chemokine 4-like [Cheilinus undulatus]